MTIKNTNTAIKLIIVLSEEDAEEFRKQASRLRFSLSRLGEIYITDGLKKDEVKYRQDN